jgi:hypothetical protein
MPWEKQFDQNEALKLAMHSFWSGGYEGALGFFRTFRTKASAATWRSTSSVTYIIDKAEQFVGRSWTPTTVNEPSHQTS